MSRLYPHVDRALAAEPLSPLSPRSLRGLLGEFLESNAARRVQAALDADENIADFHVRIAHHGSLHAAEASEGIGGY